jgi:hypothetical protein
MSRHRHRFVEEYQGLVGFGFDRETDEASLIVYLQKFADDELTALLRSRLSGEEIDQLVDLVNRTLRRHLSEEEYHRYFLKDKNEL